MISADRPFDNLYLHVPFCLEKCAYCAFYSKTGADHDEMKAWLNQIEKQLIHHSSRLRHLHTIYIGGGTPAFLPENLLTLLFQILKRHTKFCGPRSVSIE